MHSSRNECSIRVRVTALLEYIDLFQLNSQKVQIMLQISFKMPALFRNSSSNHYAQNYSGIIPASLFKIIRGNLKYCEFKMGK